MDGGERKRTQRKIKDLGNLAPGRSVRDSEGHTKGLRPCRGFRQPVAGLGEVPGEP